MNKIFVFSGHSGGGKSYVVKNITDNESISTTSRSIRKHEGEIDGIHYHFKTREQFEDILEKDGFAEWSEYAGFLYGTTKDEIEKRIEKDNVFSVLDFNGMKQIKALYPNAVSVFIYTSYEEALQQMKDRGENEETIRKRLSTYHEEVANKGHYDYVVRNKYGKKETVIELVKKIIEMES